MINDKVTVVPEGMSWPQGDRDIASLRLSSEELFAKLGCKLNEGIEPGLGPWSGIAIRTSTGTLVEFVYYHQAPLPNGVIVRTDVSSDSAGVLRDVLGLLGISESEVLWRAHDA